MRLAWQRKKVQESTSNVCHGERNKDGGANVLYYLQLILFNNYKSESHMDM